MPELTAQDVHEAAFIAYTERYANYPGAFPKGMSWEKLGDFPVRLLEALKAAADEDGMSDTEFLMSVLKSDKRIQKKLEEKPVIDPEDIPYARFLEHQAEMASWGGDE